MKFKETKQLNSSYKEQIRLLWNREYPSIIRHKKAKDFEEYLSKLKDKNHLLILEEENVLGWYCDFIRQEERWFVMILGTKIQGKGIGKKIIESIKNRYKELNGWVVVDESYLKDNNEIYKSPIDFYKKQGFTIFENEKLDSSIINVVKIQLKSIN
ncbi:GNAT family N-acetyltransferase [Tenacibaculum tangerinum]|uniref:GNAT family N-acetyltransferase n=1 Tax=Tenacibaculum tangerinum TaxID=3038772 RepID=A0ABY8KY51_9FLAO|nr:GNAT family N-acetyltransferase [Tenacibaculum tangerinum]WGH74169.1 GNAT family N-acetyltransferase [Tenacibaculum tangerinum]